MTAFTITNEILVKFSTAGKFPMGNGDKKAKAPYEPTGSRTIRAGKSAGLDTSKPMTVGWGMGFVGLIALTAFTSVFTIMSSLDNLRTQTQTGFTEIRSDITSLRVETKKDITDTRSDSKSDIAGLRTEMKSDVNELRKETNEGFNRVAEAIDKINENLSDIKVDIAEIKASKH